MRCHVNHMISYAASCAPQKALDVYQTPSLLEGGVWERDYTLTDKEEHTPTLKSACNLLLNTGKKECTPTLFSPC